MFKRTKNTTVGNIHTPRMFWALLDSVALILIAYVISVDTLDVWETDMRYLYPHYPGFVTAWAMGSLCQFSGIILLVLNQASFLNSHASLEVSGMAGLTIGPVLLFWGYYRLNKLPDPFSIFSSTTPPLSVLSPSPTLSSSDLIPPIHGRETELIDFAGELVVQAVEFVGIVILDISYFAPLHLNIAIELIGYATLMVASGCLEFEFFTEGEGDLQETRLEVALVDNPEAAAEVFGLFFLGIVAIGHYLHEREEHDGEGEGSSHEETHGLLHQEDEVEGDSPARSVHLRIPPRTGRLIRK
eukprot:gb/GEZN01011715.1/.p1 GENE.gb/GEZN01011715.1/~~gb/GEZN01011715.1/.p1  ORF type:complete len:300 (+),score=21.63 gb/GEZN01011715.1/:106-1005(+)